MRDSVFVDNLFRVIANLEGSLGQSPDLICEYTSDAYKTVTRTKARLTAQ